MIPNVAVEADLIRRRAKAGFPDGVENTALRDMQVLLRRVDELERAIVPFVRVGTLPNHGDPMVSLEHRLCVNAAMIMDRLNTAARAPVQEEYLPVHD